MAWMTINNQIYAWLFSIVPEDFVALPAIIEPLLHIRIIQLDLGFIYLSIQFVYLEESVDLSFISVQFFKTPRKIFIESLFVLIFLNLYIYYVFLCNVYECFENNV